MPGHCGRADSRRPRANTPRPAGTFAPGFKPAGPSSRSEAMRYHVIVGREVSRDLGACALGRRSLINLLNGLYHNLEGRADEFRSERHPEDETLFLYRDFLLDAG